MATPVQIDRDAFYAGQSCLEMMNNTLRWLGVAANDFNRYDQASIVNALNYSQNRFAKLTNCLLYPAVVVLKANKQSYRLPYNCLRVMAGRF